MDFKISNLGALNSIKTAQNNNTKINFKGNADIVSFSDIAKTKSEIAKNLRNIGFSDEEAQELIKKFYKSEDYNLLVNGRYDKDFDEFFTAHYIDKENNLTPTEAILYLAYDMNEYYYQNGEWGAQNELTSVDAKNYDLGNNDFSPVELSKYMLKGFDIVLSGMIVKGKLDEETAKKIQPYYDASYDNYSNTDNLREAEYTADLFGESLDDLSYWTSDKKDKEGNLLNGLTRPLTNGEAASIVKDDYLRHDTKALNNYIEMNRRFGESLYSMDLGDLWDKNPDEREVKPTNVVKAKIKRNVQDLAELIDCVAKTYPSLNSEVLGDIKALDNDKFFGRYPAESIKFDAISCINDDRELRQKNIQVLNSISNELLDKMTFGSEGKKGHFASLGLLLRTKDLDSRVQQLEDYRLNNPVLYNSMSKVAVMDYLTNSDFYTKREEAVKMFLDMLSGIDEPESSESAEIIDFPLKSE